MAPLDRLAALKPTQKAFSFFDEFKKFAFKGNVIDLAVAVIIGVEFGKIINSLVKDIIMPLVGMLLPGEKGYLGWEWRGVAYGQFIGAVVNFLIVALVLFIFIVKFIGWLTKLRKEEAAAPPPLTKDQELLTEIRDLLRKDRAGTPNPSAGGPSGSS